MTNKNQDLINALRSLSPEERERVWEEAHVEILTPLDRLEKLMHFVIGKSDLNKQYVENELAEIILELRSTTRDLAIVRVTKAIDEANGDWQPNWKDGSNKYSIEYKH